MGLPSRVRSTSRLLSCKAIGKLLTGGMTRKITHELRAIAFCL